MRSRLVNAQLVVAGVLMHVAAGCYPEGPPRPGEIPFGRGGIFYHPEHYAYVYRHGGVEEIERWTLAQTNRDRILDGANALIAWVSDPGRVSRARRAAEAVLRIHRKLVEGWPGFQPSAEGPINGVADAEGQRIQAVGIMYRLVATFNQSDEQELEPLLQRMRPDPVTQPDWHRQWTAAVEELRRAKEGYRAMPDIRVRHWE